MPSVITSRSANKQRGIPQLTIREVKREALVKAVEGGELDTAIEKIAKDKRSGFIKAV